MSKIRKDLQKFNATNPVEWRVSANFVGYISNNQNGEMCQLLINATSLPTFTFNVARMFTNPTTGTIHVFVRRGGRGTNRGRIITAFNLSLEGVGISYPNEEINE